MRTGPIAIAGILLSASAVVAAPMTPSDIQTTFFSGQPFTASTPGGTKFKMTFAPDGTMTREPSKKTGTKSSGTWKLDGAGFCTTWKKAETNCYTIVANGKSKWSVQKGTNTVAVWTK